jgi:RIO-like serine/threonine protein kinase
MLDSTVILTIQGVSYRICGKIGEGAAGYIYLCEDKDRVRYAMKKTRPKLDRFIKESV